ncbi:MAG: fructose-bisphosphatase class II, partial [Candidatus Poseidoniaceae archaeon]
MGSVSDLQKHFLEAVDQAAIASAEWRGKGDKMAADAAAVEAMRRTFDNVPFDGRVAIGEGERDEAPMLYIGEQLGNMIGVAGAAKIDIAVDPLECTNNCADNTPNSIAVLAAAPRGTLLHAPDCYMDKIAAGPALAGHISL